MGLKENCSKMSTLVKLTILHSESFHISLYVHVIYSSLPRCVTGGWLIYALPLFADRLVPQQKSSYLGYGAS